MSTHGVNFLENWIDANVTEADKNGSHGRAKELATQCKADAKAQGIALEDIASEFNELRISLEKLKLRIEESLKSKKSFFEEQFEIRFMGSL